MSMLVGNILAHYTPLVAQNRNMTELDLYFAMARGYQRDGLDLTALEIAKWLKLLLFPTTTIGSFPQTEDIRQLRAHWKKGDLTDDAYQTALQPVS